MAASSPMDSVTSLGEMLMVNKEVQKQGKDRTPRCYSVQPRADSRTDSIRQRSRCPTHMRRR